MNKRRGLMLVVLFLVGLVIVGGVFGAVRGREVTAEMGEGKIVHREPATPVTERGKQIDKVWKTIRDYLDLTDPAKSNVWDPQNKGWFSFENVYPSGGVSVSGVPSREDVVQAIKAVGVRDPVIGSPTCCGDWLARVYKWSGYNYNYIKEDYSNLGQLVNKYGPLIGYNDDQGDKGHALLLLGCGSSANWWLTQLPEYNRKGIKVENDKCLVISYSNREANFDVFDKDSYSHRITQIHTWDPLCSGERIQATSSKYGDGYIGLYYWSEDGSGGEKPWSKYWEPINSPHYPSEGICR